MWGWLIIVAGLIGTSALTVYLRMRWGRGPMEEMSENLQVDANEAIERSRSQPWFLP